jgi:hypothetical protein
MVVGRTGRRGDTATVIASAPRWLHDFSRALLVDDSPRDHSTFTVRTRLNQRLQHYRPAPGAMAPALAVRTVSGVEPVQVHPPT